MVEHEIGTGVGPGCVGEPSFRWHETVALAFAILFSVVTVAAVFMIATRPMAVDFLSYWAAARLALEGQAAAAYDIVVHSKMEATIAPIDGLLPFPYPPPYLMLVSPFGLLPFGIAVALWIFGTAILYLSVARKLGSPRVVLAQPGVLANGLIGQNGFLTTSIFIAGTQLLERRPVLAGAILGLFVFKPQLALLLPVAVIAARNWLAILGAAASCSVLLLAALLTFGIDVYRGFFETAPQYALFMQQNRWPWNELASVFAFGRWLGLPAWLALALHAALAAVAAHAVWRAWRADDPAKVPLLAGATLLMPPYLFTYDSLLLVVPIAWLMKQRSHPTVVAAIWFASLLPIAIYFGLYAGPNTTPIAAALCLLILRSQSRVRMQAALASS
ncbi:MAG: glycosyltransferase family 87 protein [Sphingomicrobium sp.]